MNLNSLPEPNTLVVKIVKSIFEGSSSYVESSTSVNEAIAAYTSAIVDLSASLGINLLVQSKALHAQIHGLSDRVEKGFTHVETHIRTAAGINIFRMQMTLLI